MLLRKTIACLVASTAMPVFAQSVPIQHEVSVGFSDVRDADDHFIGVSYRYYFQTVNINEQPWAISPYLQRADSVTVDYFGIDSIDSINVRGAWFYSNDLVVRARYGRVTDDGRNRDETIQRFGADVSTFANDNWEYGAGVDFYDSETSYYSAMNHAAIVDRYSDSEFSFNVFARYTSFGTSTPSFSPGWDVKAKATKFDDEYSLELDADYFIKRNWSVGMMAIHESNDRFGSENVIELGTDYWFNPYSSIKFGLGLDTDESRLGSVTLLGTFRF